MIFSAILLLFIKNNNKRKLNLDKNQSNIKTSNKQQTPNTYKLNFVT